MNRVDYLSRCRRHGELMEANMMEFIEEYIKLHGYAPSYKEIGQGVGLQSESTVYYHMKRLFEQGRLETDLPDRFSVPRAFRIARG